MPSRCLEEDSAMQAAEVLKVRGKEWSGYLAQRSGVDLGRHSDGSRIRQCQLVGHRVGQCR